METNNRSARICVQNQAAGTLSETDDGYMFIYDSGYAGPAVSLTLPLREEAYCTNVLFPFFDGLIPEGYLLQLVEKNWKIDPKDRFGLLLAACKDCIGDVEVHPEETE